MAQGLPALLQSAVPWFRAFVRLSSVCIRKLLPVLIATETGVLKRINTLFRRGALSRKKRGGERVKSGTFAAETFPV